MQAILRGTTWLRFRGTVWAIFCTTGEYNLACCVAPSKFLSQNTEKIFPEIFCLQFFFGMLITMSHLMVIHYWNSISCISQEMNLPVKPCQLVDGLVCQSEVFLLSWIIEVNSTSASLSSKSMALATMQTQISMLLHLPFSFF